MKKVFFLAGFVLCSLASGYAATIIPDPGNMVSYASYVGQSFLVELTGSTTAGNIWGTDYYTHDSRLSVACVHAGVLSSGQRAVVRVSMLAGRSSYTSSTRYGVTSQSWGAWNTSYSVAYYSGLSSASVTINNTSQVYNGSQRPVSTQTSPSGLSVNVTYNGSTTVPINAGSYSVVATVTSPGYQGSRTATLTISKASQTVSFSAIADQEQDATVTLSASASSGKTITFSCSGPAQIDGNEMTFTGTGNVTVTASQSGDSNWQAASAQQTFLVKPSSAALSVSPDHGPETGGTEVTVTGTALGNGSDIKQVNICNMDAVIQSQTADSVTVRTGGGMEVGAGDVIICSASQGEQRKNNGFTADEQVSPQVTDVQIVHDTIDLVWETTPAETYQVWETGDLMQRGKPPMDYNWSLKQERVSGGNSDSVSFDLLQNQTRKYIQVARAGNANGADLYGVFRIALRTGWTAISVPVTMNMHLNSDLGDRLASVLPAADNEALSQAEIGVWDGSSWDMFWLRTGGIWCESGSASETGYQMPEGRGFFVYNAGISTSVVFAGEVQQCMSATNTILAGGHSMVTLSRGTAIPVQNAFKNLISGAPQGTGNSDTSDMIYHIDTLGAWHVYQYVDGTGTAKDGKWIDVSAGGAVAGNSFQPGETLYYFRNGTQMRVKY